MRAALLRRNVIFGITSFTIHLDATVQFDPGARPRQLERFLGENQRLTTPPHRTKMRAVL